MQSSFVVIVIIWKKSKLYKDEPKHVMNDKLLEKFIEEYINSQTMPQILSRGMEEKH